MQSIATSRTLHQIQLELEYDEEESDREGRQGSAIHVWKGGLQRRAARMIEDAEDEADKEIHALCIFDDVTEIVSSDSASAALQKLRASPAVRKWARWRWRHPPSHSDKRCVEAIMVYERGVSQHPEDRCNRCRSGQGISPQCVVAPTESWPGGECSNCLFDNVDCNGTPSRIAAELAKGDGDSLRVVDHMAVLELIARLKRPPGAGKEHTLPGKAKRIEVAALQIAQAARDWGEKISRGARRA
ncbi:hypothetical protein JDV02_009401 [Purpureocillium takamizusanense]|uniref:Uncharacterized protein n=1 Tax=Purpureocillium takamizusanense TaxID=2060973 RepID=A0A9Q8QQR7_9HYPO|nr:uncharacterized protein JDV02_009401 [Purpureocillium takamizusanense]UNI23591.1 hypothetical protein JDV02_009401 [Purpureocillium takamizusanense]